MLSSLYDSAGKDGRTHKQKVLIRSSQPSSRTRSVFWLVKVAGRSYHKRFGLGFKTPREAIDGIYIDKKCPFTGNLSIRGRILSGVVTKMKMQRTIVRGDYLHYIRKYNRFEKRHKNMSVHLSPAFSLTAAHSGSTTNHRPAL
ncbi:40S ribosomal protein S11-like [Oncorhynchus keta]|uniref:40S ribosomal protein S11-like n=1 Tax=Oncorhynchus keta TaxID=8018 RepID=UPI00227BB100|nr:40S ribosomal protein S11-like [Oncorhynchus keta]